MKDVLYFPGILCSLSEAVNFATPLFWCLFQLVYIFCSFILSFSDDLDFDRWLLQWIMILDNDFTKIDHLLALCAS